MRSHLTTAAAAAGLLALAIPQTSHADETWLLNAQGAATRTTHVPSVEYFQPGGSAGFGVYRSLTPHIQLGGRVSGMMIPEDVPNPELESSGDLAIGAMTGMMRIRPMADPFESSRGTGLYIEAGGGPALVGSEVTGAVDVGLGWNFAVADTVALGPNLRYLQAIETDDRFVSEDPRVWMAGIEMSLLGDVNPPVRPVVDNSPDVNVVVNMPQRRGPIDTDNDRVADRFDHCPMDKEVFNQVDDHDGCPDKEEVAFDDDSLVIDEAVFFGFDQNELTDRGRATLLDVATTYHNAETPWSTLIVRGHADRRGGDDYNVELSWQRATAVKDALTQMGVPEDIIVLEAYGESAPQVEAPNKMARHLNRRVEFVVKR